MLLAKFVVNGSNGLGGVGKSKFIIFSQSLSGSWGSSHLGFMSFGQTNVETRNTCVLSKMDRKLNNFSIVWNIKILLITFCQESPQVPFAKFGNG